MPEKITHIVGVDLPEDSSDEPIEQIPLPQRSTRAKIILSIIGLVLFVLVLVFSFFFFSEDANNKVVVDFIYRMKLSSVTLLAKIPVPFIGNYFNNLKKMYEPVDDSVFGTLLDKNESPHFYVVDYSLLDKNFYNSIKYFLNTGDIFGGLESSWNWENSWIYAKVNKIDQSGIDLEIVIPRDKGNVSVKYTCDLNKTILIDSRDNKVIATNGSFYTNAFEGDFIYTHCLNAECSLVGNGCVVMK